MSETVWKFTARIDDDQVVWMPRGAEILHAGIQHGYADRFEIWARVDPDADEVGRFIYVRGTGHPLPDYEPPIKHVASFVVAGGALVWHVFDGGEQIG